MVDYSRLETALDYLAESLEIEASSLRLMKVAGPEEYQIYINQTIDKLRTVVLRLEALNVDLL
jgi:hypothetical protein